MSDLRAQLFPVLLFLHLLTVAAAFAAVGVLHSSLLRLRKATRASAARHATESLVRVGPRMPFMALALVLTGAAVAQAGSMWRAPFVGVGIAGLAIMQALGVIFLKPRLERIAQALPPAGDEPLDASLVEAVRDPVFHTVGLVQPSIACGIMFGMVVRPGIVGSTLGVVIAAAIALAAGALAARGAPAVATETQSTA